MRFLIAACLVSSITSIAAQAETIKCFGAVDDHEFSNFSESFDGDTRVTRFENSDYLIEARRKGSASAVSVSLVHKISGIYATSVGWPKVDVTLRVPSSTGRAQKIEAVCVYNR